MSGPAVQVAFVGPHNSGKTGLVSKLTKLASKGGVKVGVVKRAALPVELDTSGKDSGRFATAGAARVITSGPGVLFIKEPGHEYPGAKALLKRFGTGVDLWLMESYVPESLAWCRVARKGQTAPKPDRYCVATIGAAVPGSDLPHFRLDRPKPILEFILSTVA